MAPKYKGRSDDWLDADESTSKGRSLKKKSAKKEAQLVPWEKTNGIVAEVYPKLCRVQTDDGLNLLCNYRRSTVIGDERKERAPVAVGDRVLVEASGSTDGVVQGRADRKNRLARPAPAQEETLSHVLVANIDLLAIVSSVQFPDFSPGLVDRFLIASQNEGIPALVCVNKIDLRANEAQSPWRMYQDLGVEVVECSPKRGIGIPELYRKLVGKTVAFCGHSGVGKTSLLNALMGQSVGRVGDVNEATGKGRHTTTGAVLLGGPESSRWIDTPGVRAFGLIDIEPDSLHRFFPELAAAGCPPACRHRDEAGCKAAALPRYQSYRRILESLESGER